MNSALEKFDGKTDWGEYLNYFGLCAKIEGWDEQMLGLQLAANLTGAARSALNELPFEDQIKFEVVTEYLGKRYRKTDAESRDLASYERRKQEKGETVREFADNLRKLHKRAYRGMDEVNAEKSLRQHFLDGLASRESSNVILMHGYQKFDELVRAAERYEHCAQDACRHNPPYKPVLAVGSDCSSKDSQQNLSQDPGNQLCDKLSGIVTRLENVLGSIVISNSSFTNSPAAMTRNSTPTCYRCGKLGHVRRNCRASYCMQCKRYGHHTSQCRVPPPIFRNEPGRGGSDPDNGRNQGSASDSQDQSNCPR